MDGYIIKGNTEEINSTFDNVRTSIKAASMYQKCLVDEMTLENIDQVDKIEGSLLELPKQYI